MSFNQVLQTEGVVMITFICLFVNVCKFVLYIASLKWERFLSNKGNSLYFLSCRKASSQVYAAARAKMTFALN